MLDSLYLEAVRKKDSITETLPDFDNEGTINEFWEDFPFSPSSSKFSIGAGDGSFNKKKYLSFTFFAVACESLIYDDEFIKIDESVIDSIEHIHYLDDLLRTYMSVLETKYAIKTIEEFDVDYYLFDGSLFGDLIRPFPNGINISKSVKEDILKITLDELRENIKYSNSKLIAPSIIEKYYKKTMHENQIDYKMFLTSVEQLLLLKQLFENKKNIIAISKTSTNKELFNTNIPDISIFDKYTKKSGISKIIYKNVSEDIKYNFIVENDFFKNLKFTIFYLRLEDNKNVLKVELPYEASKEEIIDLVKKIKKYSVDGYPYLLKKAHKDVVISNKDMVTLASMVNVNEKIGREMLR